MTIIEKIKKLFEDKKRIISVSYIASFILGIITLGLFTLDLDTGKEYKNFYMISLKQSSDNIAYFLIAIIVIYFFVTSTISFVTTSFFERKDPKVKSNSIKYARFNELLAISLTSVFSIIVLVLFCLVHVLIDESIDIGISILLGIFAFLTIFISGIGDYYDEVLNNKRAREIIEERKKQAEEAKLIREKKEETKKEEKEEVKQEVNFTPKKQVSSTTKKTKSNKKQSKK